MSDVLERFHSMSRGTFDPATTKEGRIADELNEFACEMRDEIERLRSVIVAAAGYLECSNPTFSDPFSVAARMRAALSPERTEKG